MNGLSYMMLGAALVVIGVLAAALADRVRGVPPARARALRTAVTTGTGRVSRRRHTTVAGSDPGADAVIDALVTAGYSRRAAAAATAGCSPDQRATPETWARAALRRCSRGEA